ncbi:hypothetical protein HY11_09655 [Hyphomonas pacifica]|nr:hypothetical protein HY11_09655 [Hyphomonas pacifica]
MGLLAAFVGYSASFAIVLAGLTAMGANDSQVATGLFFATLGMGLCSIWLPLATRIPAAIACGCSLPRRRSHPARRVC